MHHPPHHSIPSVTASALAAIPNPQQLGVPDIGMLGEDSWEFVVASSVTQSYHRLAWHLHYIASVTAKDPKTASYVVIRMNFFFFSFFQSCQARDRE